MMENENTMRSNPPAGGPRKKSFLKRYFALILILLVIALAITSAYFYKKSTTNIDQASVTEVRSLVEKVGRLTVLPTGETPTIATVSDPEALRDQAFFVDAKKGYKVLIYSNAKKAFLYDPVSDKIVNIAPLNTGDTNSVTPTLSPETSEN